MIVIIIGVISLILCIMSAVDSSSREGVHRATWSGKGGNDGVPTFIHVLWFFFSVVAIAGGYVYVATN